MCVCVSRILTAVRIPKMLPFGFSLLHGQTRCNLGAVYIVKVMAEDWFLVSEISLPGASGSIERPVLLTTCPGFLCT